MRRIRRFLLGVVAAAAILFAAESGYSLFEKGLVKERADADLRGAIKIYEQVVRENSRDRKLAAQALVRMGQCYERLGDADARKAYERVVREFGDQKDSVALAQAGLAAMGGDGSGSGPRLIDTDDGVISASPDGRFLLVWSADQGFDLRDARTGQVRSLVKGRVWGGAFSPDGRQITFSRTGDSTFELHLAEVDGSGQRLLWKPDQGQATWRQWFPDGKRILMGVFLGHGTVRLVAVSTADGAATTLWEGTDYGRGQLSPDGGSVVFVRRVSQDPVVNELRLLTLADRSESTLLQWQPLIGYPVWTPDGSGLVFPSDRRSPGVAVDLWLLRVSGGKPLGTPELIRKDIGPVVNGDITVQARGPITRDGVLYFRKGRRATDGMTQLMTVGFDPDTGKVVGTPKYVSRMGGVQRTPSFSRDGRWLAYSVQNPANIFSLVIQAVESGEERVVRLDPKPVSLEVGVWFPDGRSVLVDATHPRDGRGIYRVDVATGVWTSLKKPGEKGEVRGWPNGISPDGKTIYIGRDNASHVFAREIETGQEREVAQVIPWVFGLALDGTQLAAATEDGKDVVLKSVPTAGGPSREIFRDSRFRGIWDPTWTPDGRSVIFSVSRSSQRWATEGYMIVPIEGGTARDIGVSASLDGQFPRYFGAVRVHPNGRQIVYVGRGGPEGPNEVHYETWALENFLPKAAK